MLTHSDFETKDSIEFDWISPKAGSGCVSIKAQVFQTETLWFKDDGFLTKTLCETEKPIVKTDIPECCACTEARYSLEFKGIWNKETHPRHWPQNEGLLHWSNLIGAIHSRNYTLWEQGSLSSFGLQELAEFGITRTLEQEIRNHSNFNTIRNIFTANGLWFPNLNSMTNSEFTVSKSHHLFTFASMIGPSPDWFTGVSKLNLCQLDCLWKDSYEEDLYLYDAGTDSGTTYMSVNKPSNPKEVIKKITTSNDLSSPFYEQDVSKEMKPFAKVVLKKLRTRGPECVNGKLENGADQNALEDPTVFDPNDYSDINRRVRLLDTESTVLTKKSRIKSKKINFIEISDFNCMTTEWSEWTECSSSCGNGLRSRLRRYKDLRAAQSNHCDVNLDEQEVCVSPNGVCGTNKAGEQIDECLMLTKWSSWSPCSVSCGKGTTIRTRSYTDRMLSKKCNMELSQIKECMVAERCIGEELMSYAEIQRICSLEKKKGPCRMTVPNVRFYFDNQRMKCMPFDYGGCRGNENNFESLDKCENTCGLMNEISDETSKEPPSKVEKFSPNFVTARKETCLQAREEGTCHELQIKYYFDRTKLVCLPFEYSGCDGNNNNFNTLEECQSDCHIIIDYITKEEMDSVNYLDLTLPEKKRICMSPAEKGTCSEQVERYYYNINMGKCLTFEYSGCDGNLNNFKSVVECETACDALIQMAAEAAEFEQNAVQAKQQREMCMLPKEQGPCVEYTEKFYFDSVKGLCSSFKFGGCFGNENNFGTLDECAFNCGSLMRNQDEQNFDEIQNAVQNQLSHKQKQSICKKPVHEGWCNGRLKRYYFDIFSEQCRQFYYTGCDGNENNFLTEKECENMCTNKYDSVVEKGKEKNEETNVGHCIYDDWSIWSECFKGKMCNDNYQMRERKVRNTREKSEKEQNDCTSLIEKRTCFLENCI